MASAGTLLSDLDSKTPVFNSKDDDLVNKILADMNMPSQSNPIMNAPPPPSGNGNRMIHSPNPNTTYPMATDSSTATSHMIGKDYPSSADFANLMYSPSYTHGGSSFANVSPHTNEYPVLIENNKSTFYSDLFAQIKQPLFVSIVFFIISLPIVNVIIGNYMPFLLRFGGDLTTAGMVFKSLLGGFLFWFIQKIIVPLMTV